MAYTFGLPQIYAGFASTWYLKSIHKTLCRSRGASDSRCCIVDPLLLSLPGTQTQLPRLALEEIYLSLLWFAFLITHLSFRKQESVFPENTQLTSQGDMNAGKIEWLAEVSLG